MTREEFLDALRKRLNRLPSEELESALDYYNEIFLDAGEENEQETAEKLGSIDNIARQIYNENGIDPDGRPAYMVESYDPAGDPGSEDPEFAESVYERMKRKRQERRAGVDVQEPELGPSVLDRVKQGEFSTARLVLVICLFPIWLPLLIVAFVLSFVFSILGMVLEVVFISVGVVSLISGVVYLFSIPPVGIMSLGIGLILVGLFILTMKAVFKGCFKMFAGMASATAGLFRTIIYGGAANG
ncbi:MAG: DUF1700 domain-containing protein [Ruminococcus sp.]|nr:DUF1700 domain-containing protein [Ruminococcus sp.]